MEEFSDNSTSNPSVMPESSSNGIGSGELKKRAFDLSGGDPLVNHSASSQNGMTNHVNDSTCFIQPSQSKDHHSSKTKDHSSSSHKHSSSSSKHKEGGSSKDKYKSHSSSSMNHTTSSSKDKHREGSSSSSKHKEGSSSSSSEHRHKSKDGSSSSSKSKEHSSSSSSSKPKEHGSSSSSSKPREHSSSSSSSKPKEGSGSSSSKSHGSSSSKPRDGSEKPKEGSSSSSKHGSSSHSSSRDKDKHSSSSKDKDRHRDKSREGSSSKSEKPREKSEKGDGDRSKPKESRDKDKERSKSSSSSSSPKKEVPGERMEKPIEVKKEVKPSDSPVKSSAPLSPVKTAMSPVKTSMSPVKTSMSPTKIPKKEPMSEDEDDTPLSHRLLNVSDNHAKEVKKEKVENKPLKRPMDSDDDEPLSSRMEKVKKVKTEPVDEKPKKKKKKKTEEEEKPAKGKKRRGGKDDGPDAKKGKTEEQIWRWWEEERRDDGVKWNFLEHKGPVFAPDYERLPKDIIFKYDGEVMRLSQETEEVATFYAKMLDHEYTTRGVFNTNFFKDWRKVMTTEEKEKIKDLKKCYFVSMADYFKLKTEEKKQMTKEEKQRIKEYNAEIQKQYGFCKIDGHTEKIGNFKIEPPGLFRGRGDHPKQGMLKRRVQPEDVIINCSKDSKIPQPPAGHKWKEVRHDSQVTWLASWTENIQGSTKYVMLNAASKLKGEKDWQKYEVARKLHKCVDKIRATYREDWKSKEMRIRQRAVALYFIDKLALRAGNEKEEGETADTVGCCSLRVEHLELFEELDGKQYVVELDFLGKDSIRYTNRVPVEKRVYKNVELFMENKQDSDDIFDRLNTAILNKHLHDLMEGLTAKVFRTYNASRTLQEQLDLLTNPDDSIPAKILSYNRANRAVAVLCNHQRSVPKTFAKSMENLMNKIAEKKKQVKEAKKAVKDLKSAGDKNSLAMQKRKKAVSRLQEQLTKLEVQATDKDENKEIALGTSKLNYLDPRISVAWCKKNDVPIEKIYNKTQRDKFRWAIDMAGPEFKF